MDGEHAYRALLGGIQEAASCCRGLGAAATDGGFAIGYIGRLVTEKTHPTAKDLLAVPETLGVGNIATWIRSRVFPPVDVVAMLRHLPHPSKPPTVVTWARRALHRIASERDAQPHQPGKFRFLGELQSLESAMQQRALKGYRFRKRPAFVAALVDWLDIYRYDRPAEAARLARIAALELVPKGHLETQLRAMAVFASSVRMGGSMTLAGMVLAEALSVAYRCGPKVEAELIQRASYILRDHARHAEALEASNMAAILYVSDGDYAGLGKVATDKGIAHYLRGDTEAAEGELRTALRLLPKSAKRHRFGTRLALCGTYAKAGRMAEALREIRRAEALLDPMAAHDRLSVTYTRAGLTDNHAEREKLLRSAGELARRFSPFDSALICLDLLSLYVDQGRREEVITEGNTVRALMHPLRFHQDAREALCELVRLNGKMRARDIARARRIVQQARRTGTLKAEIL